MSRWLGKAVVPPCPAGDESDLAHDFYLVGSITLWITPDEQTIGALPHEFRGRYIQNYAVSVCRRCGGELHTEVSTAHVEAA